MGTVSWAVVRIVLMVVMWLLKAVKGCIDSVEEVIIGVVSNYSQKLWWRLRRCYAMRKKVRLLCFIVVFAADCVMVT